MFTIRLKSPDELRAAQDLCARQGQMWYGVVGNMSKVWMQMPYALQERLFRGLFVKWDTCIWQPEMFHFEPIELKSQCGCYWSSHKLFCKCE